MTTNTRRAGAPPAIERCRVVAEPALRAAVAGLSDARMSRIAGYQLGFWDAAGEPSPGASGKAVRPTLALLAAEAVSGELAPGTAAAVAVELVHNFSLLHDDIMDRDVERRHRPTGWVVFGDGQAILAGNAMLTSAIETVVRDGRNTDVVLPALMHTVQRLISGQSEDLALERRADADLDEVLHMEVGKTAALISCASSIGAMAAGAPNTTVDSLAEYGRLVGLAFQLVDDVLGIVGDPAVTGKSASSDLRAGKRSVPVVAALADGGTASRQLAALLADGPPQTDEQVARGAQLVIDAGGIAWTTAEAEKLLGEAAGALAAAALPRHAEDGFEAMAAYLVRRAS